MCFAARSYSEAVERIIKKAFALSKAFFMAAALAIWRHATGCEIIRIIPVSWLNAANFYYQS